MDTSTQRKSNCVCCLYHKPQSTGRKVTCCLFFFFFFSLLDIFFIYISNAIPKAPITLPHWLYEGAPLPIHTCPPTLAFPYTGALNTLRPKGLSSHLCSTRPSSATYAASAVFFGWWSSPWELWGRGSVCQILTQ